ncbi:MAG: hypothetical protein QME40_02375, partial [bacterium]|nr:hypothetical protein [bacterium]
MIEVIIFDLGGVILNFDHHIICRRLSKISKYEEHEVYDFIFASGLENSYNEGKITSLEFFDTICKKLDLDITFHNF